MTIPANTVWEVRYDGDNTNGGGWVTGSSGTDYSQQAAPQWSVTDAVTNGTTTITSATANFDASVVGNVLYIVVAGTAYRRYVTAYTNSTTIVVDATLSSGSGQTMKIGGAVANFGSILSGSGSARIQSAGNIIYVKYNASSYAISSGSHYGFCFLAGTVAAPNYIVGYDTTRTLNNTDANRPTFLNTYSQGVFYTSNNCYYFRNLIIDNNNTLFAYCVYLANGGVGHVFERCDFLNYYGSSAVDEASCNYITFIRCKFSGNTSGYSIAGIRITANTYIEHCEFLAGRYAINVGSAAMHVQIRNTTIKGQVLASLISTQTGGLLNVTNCNFVGNTTHAIDISGASPVASLFENCIVTNNGGWGWYATSRKDVRILNCAGYSNTSGDYNSTYITNVTGFISLSGDPFVDRTNNNFALDTTAGEGNALRQVGYPTTSASGSSTNYLDIGAIQNAAAGGSAGARLVGASALVTPGGHV